mmetsp:Transcript_1431/g.4515  ORF Transcript_1431/g.4515 Transcript_1431/m.4515 type:complete len:310 (-) Transcript_1431:782-1711(-)
MPQVCLEPGDLNSFAHAQLVQLCLISDALHEPQPHSVPFLNLRFQRHGRTPCLHLSAANEHLVNLDERHAREHHIAELERLHPLQLACRVHERPTRLQERPQGQREAMNHQHPVVQERAKLLILFRDVFAVVPVHALWIDCRRCPDPLVRPPFRIPHVVPPLVLPNHAEDRVGQLVKAGDRKDDMCLQHRLDAPHAWPGQLKLRLPCLFPRTVERGSMVCVECYEIDRLVARYNVGADSIADKNESGQLLLHVRSQRAVSPDDGSVLAGLLWHNRRDESFERGNLVVVACKGRNAVSEWTTSLELLARG